MKRPRQTAHNDERVTAHLALHDHIKLLADALRGVSTAMVLPTHDCAWPHSATQNRQREAADILPLVVLNTDSLPPPSKEAEVAYQRTVICGLGVIDSFLSSDAQSQLKEGLPATLTYRVVPVLVRFTPWVPQLPTRLLALVCDEGRFASLSDDRDFGPADVGPVPEGYVARDAVAVLPSFPRCYVDAVSGHFPLFHRPPLSAKAAASDDAAESTEVRWYVRNTGDVDQSTRDALMQKHLKRLARYSDERVVKVLSVRMRCPESWLNRMWVAVSYPGGLPPLPQPTDGDDGDHCTAPPLSKNLKTERAELAVASEDAPFSSPLFLLPARFLCHNFYMQAGWQQIAPEYRAAALNAVHHLRVVIEATPLRCSDGSVVAAKAVCDAPGGRPVETATLTKASAI
jgi:hypothetical protein